MTVNKTTSDCTIYAFVGTAILAISLVVAMYVGNDFHQSLFVESIIFVGSNILLWAIFISMVNCPYELMTIGSNSKTKKSVVEAEHGVDAKRITSSCERCSLSVGIVSIRSKKPFGFSFILRSR